MDMLKGLNNSKEIIYQRDLAITSNHMPYLFTPAFITFNYLTILNANWVYSNQFIFIHSRRESKDTTHILTSRKQVNLLEEEAKYYSGNL
ncbi:unnamed protein product [Gordionus sp. m RMFG-2023]